MMKKDFFKSILLSLSFASLVFAFQNCSGHSQDAFAGNVKAKEKKITPSESKKNNSELTQ